MAKLHQIYQRLKSIPDRCVDQAIAQAMPTAEPASLSMMAKVLLQRNQGRGPVALVEQYHRLPEDLQKSVLQHAPEFAGALRLTIASKHKQGPANTIHIIRRSMSTRQAYLIAEQLRRGHDDLKDQSAQCLLEMAQRTTPGLTNGEEAKALVDPVEAGFVQSAIHEAIRFYAQHKRKDVLEAMFSLPMPAVASLLNTLDEVGAALVNETGVTLTRADSDAVRRSLLIALPVDGLASYVLDGLRLGMETGTTARALTHWHLLLLKRYRTPLARIKSPEGYCPSPQKSKQTKNPAGPGLAQWLWALPLDGPSRVRQLGALRQAPDPATRLLALRRLLALAQDAPPDAPVHSAIAGYCTDQAQPIARVALAHLVHCDYPATTQVLAKLINSPHPEVQRIAGRRLAPVAFLRLWDNWPKLNPAQRIGAGRALIKIDPKFHATLADQLTLTDKPTRLRALSIVGELNQGLLVQDRLLGLCRDKDPYVVSAAVKALGSAEPDVAAPVVESALDHEDPRVRANAVEALAQLDIARHADRIAEMTHEHQANRARANAIQGLMQTRTADALQALSTMLSDPRPTHRASALWLVESMGIAEVARQVAEMSISETDPQIKQRASRVIGEMIEQMSVPLPIHALTFDDDTMETSQANEDHAAAG